MALGVADERGARPEFSQEAWDRCMEWLWTGAQDAPADPAKQQQVALAVATDADVGRVERWRRGAEPLPAWAVGVDSRLPRWGLEICHIDWVAHLERLVEMIAHETLLPDDGPIRCGRAPALRLAWAAMAVGALDRWLLGQPPIAADPPLYAEIASLLGERDAEKSGAVSYLREALALALRPEGPAAFDAAFGQLAPAGALAAALHGPVSFVQYICGYRWDRIVMTLCRMIGDESYRHSRPVAFNVGACNGQLAFVYQEDPERVWATCGIALGVWAWLGQVPPAKVAARYPTCARVAERVRGQLGDLTPVKCWLAGRLYLGIRTWMQATDHGDIAQPHPAIEPFPALADALERVP